MTLNLTLALLTISNLHQSPLLSIQQTSINLYKSTFSYSYTHIIYNSYQLRVNDCTFKQFRKSAIYIDGTPWNFTGYQKGRMKDQPIGNELVLIYDAVFEDCIVEDRGAAIFHYIPAWFGSCNASRSSFIRCQTQDQGGAIFFVGHDFFMDSCFAYNCSAIFGQFIYTFLYLNEDQVNAVNYTSTLMCSIDNETGKDSGIKLWYGAPMVFELNTTLNWVAWESAAVYAEGSRMGNTSIYFCTFDSCRGSSMIHATGHYQATLDFCNMVNCTLTDNEVGHIDIENSGIISHCVFLKNVGETLFFLHENATIELFKCKFDRPKGDWLKIDHDECRFNLDNPKTVCNDHLNTFVGKPYFGGGENKCSDNFDKKHELLQGSFNYARLIREGKDKHFEIKQVPSD